ncbi:exo-alpha-sialidase [Anditalea andensis]|uniref:Sialidase domain-containing protein n=1 Tax=Anditalea andensis TaxID=1048983 RepID=A0A074L2D6_9BACT|nr:exo-alpha-sialidase [Anditalea andensis]KEO75344.1 hypothetical protein EL17_02045 [Anditalea andensis]
MAINFFTEEGIQYGEPYLLTYQGKTFLSFRETENNTHRLRYTILQEDGWASPVTIATGNNWFVNWADYPQLVALPKGNMLSFYLEKSGPSTFSYDIMVTTSTEGMNWDEAKILHDDAKKVEHGFVSLQPYDENVFIAWLDGRNTAEETHHGHTQVHGEHGPMSLRGAITDIKGNKLHEWELDQRVCDCCQTTSAITDNGPIVVYRGRSITEIRNINIIRLVNGQWTKPKPIYDDNWMIKGCPVNGPRAAATGNHLAIAWFTEAQGKAEVKVIFSEDGGATFGHPILINEGHTIGRVDIAMLDTDMAVVTWMEGPLILARKVKKDHSLGPVITVAKSSDNRSSGFPQLTVNNGHLILAWTDSNEAYPQIKTAILKDF